MNNTELRTAIRETEKTCGLTVSESNRDAFDHLTALRAVERRRADAMLAAPGDEPDTHESCYSLSFHNSLLRDKVVEIASLKAELAKYTEPLTDDEAAIRGAI